MNPLRELESFGQSVWLDYVRRGLIASGELQRMIEEDGLKGVTSNPSIFEKAIGGSADYDDALKALAAEGDHDANALYEALAVEDIRDAADLLRPVFERTGGIDGYISLEVSPYHALKGEETLAEARRLWAAVGRENLMVKVPATEAGIPVIRELTAEGVNVNVTLLFSRAAYGRVAEAYLSGLERRVAAGGDPARVASVASFFVSRIDTAVGAAVDARLDATASGNERAALGRLKGTVAIANAKLAYALYKELFSGERWRRLAGRGARPQRLLWASTGAKDPALRDVAYVEGLIGPDTVNTMPPATLEAFRHHGRPRACLEEGLDEARGTLDALEGAGIDLDAITGRLLDDAVCLFVEAFDKLLGAVEAKREAVLGDRLDAQALGLPAGLRAEVDAALEGWRAGGKVRRLWARDRTLWTGRDEDKWLGWLDAADDGLAHAEPFSRLAEEVRAAGFETVLLLGMGGSSLGPEVLAGTFGPQPGFPRLVVLDSTDPAQVRAAERRADPARTLHVVSSKSGSTLEPNILKAHFLERARAALGAERAAGRFVAVTDPGSPVERAAEADGFRRVYHGRASIGGRYSVLSNFGLVPAAAIGLDVGRLLEGAERMVRSCAPSVPPAQNPGVALGAVLGVAGLAGRDKVTVVAGPGLADFGAWLEQLIAESTGKGGRGLIPVDGEPLGPPEVYGADRLFVGLAFAGRPDAAQGDALAALEAAGHPVVRIALADPYQLGQEFFRWEMATAVAGAILGVNPFDQPDVEASKVATRELTDAAEREGALPPEAPFLEADGIKLFADERNAAALGGAGGSLVTALRAHLGRLGPGDYAAILAYVERAPDTAAALQAIRLKVRDARRVATCVGFGPRFLHSTGQAYKGGPNTGVVLQVTADDALDIPVPGRALTFGTVKAAQARGDFQVLSERGRRALRVHLGPDVRAGLATLRRAVAAALEGEKV